MKNQTFTRVFRPVLIYDGKCGFCIRWVARLRRWDSAETLELVPFQDPSIPLRFPQIPQEALDRAIQLVAPDGTIREGAAAVEEIARLLPAGRRVAWLFRLPLARPFAERLYRLVARNRHLLACQGHCGVPVAHIDR